MNLEKELEMPERLTREKVVRRLFSYLLPFRKNLAFAFALLVVATAALQAIELVGLPEGVLPLTQTVTYLALAPKSNRALTTYAAARKAVRDHGALPVPAKLRPGSNASSKALGHGHEYKYPHDFEGAYVAEDYLPDALIGTRLYEPSDSGFEKELAARLAAIERKRSKK